jgi:hypothetical protein
VLLVKAEISNGPNAARDDPAIAPPNTYTNRARNMTGWIVIPTS